MNAPNPLMFIPLYLQNCSFIYSQIALHITKSWLFGSNGLKEGDVLSQGSKCLPGKRSLFFNILFNIKLDNNFIYHSTTFSMFIINFLNLFLIFYFYEI